MHQRTSYSRTSPYNPERRSLAEIYKRASKYLDPAKLTPLPSIEDHPVDSTTAELKPPTATNKEVQTKEGEDKTSIGNKIKDKPQTANPSIIDTKTPTSNPIPIKDNETGADNKPNLYESKSYKDNSKAELNKPQTKPIQKITLNSTQNLSVTKPVAEHIFSGVDPKDSPKTISHDDNSFILKIARLKREDRGCITRSNATTIDFSKSLIEKKGYFIDNDESALINEEDLLQKKLENLKKMHQNLKRENLDLKTTIIEKQISRREINTQIELLQKKVNRRDIDDDSFKKMKAQQWLLVVENSIKATKTSDSHPLFSKLISMTRRHTSELRSTYQELDRVKEMNDSEKARLKSMKVVDLSSL